MAAPQYVPIPATGRASAYRSPGYVPEAWTADRPADLEGRQPVGERLGYQGPDQGYGMMLAERFMDKLQLQPGERADDALTGCGGVALRRASMFGRAPMIHDYTVAFTIFGFLDASPPAELASWRKAAFEGVRHVGHHYTEAREIVDAIPAGTLRLGHQQVAKDYPSKWRELLGQ